MYIDFGKFCLGPGQEARYKIGCILRITRFNCRFYCDFLTAGFRREMVKAPLLLLLFLCTFLPFELRADEAEEQQLQQHIEGLLAKGERRSFASNIDQKKLSYTVYGEQGSKGPIVILPGKGESSLRYAPVVDEMNKRGYGPFYVLDHRGQGLSERNLPKKPNTTDVVAFDHYVDDFLQFMHGPVRQDLAKRNLTSKPLLLAHSMGGAIANLALQKEPELVDRVAYVAPMFDIKLGKAESLGKKIPRYIMSFLCMIGCGKKDIGPTKIAHRPIRADKSILSSDAQRIAVMKKIERANGAEMPGFTIRWVREAMLATEKIRAKAGDQKTSSMIFVAGSDSIVSNQVLNEYKCNANGCELTELKGKHALHNEAESIRSSMFDLADQFFQGGKDGQGGHACPLSFAKLMAE